MSLKVFHIFFIAVSVVTAFGFGAWGIYFHIADPNLGYLLMGVFSSVTGVALVYYGIRFLQKFKHLGNL